MTRVGVISDTHGLLRPEAVAALAGVDLIIHAGDVGDAVVVRELERIAPVYAVRGNVDPPLWPESLALSIESTRIHVRHIYAGMPPDCDALIVGHSHKPLIEHRDGKLLLNPGSAGRRRFKLPVTVATLIIDGGSLDATIVRLCDAC